MWGGGGWNYSAYYGGLFMASSVSKSCAIWNNKVIGDDQSGFIGPLGDISRLRSCLPDSEMREKYDWTTDSYIDKEVMMKEVMEKDHLYWLTDRTPHEALANDSNEPVYRQFFRLVTANVSVWYENHSTPNPNGVVPDPQRTTIIKGNKFTV